MSKNNENKLVPKLRFPDFINYNEWDEKPLGNISNRITEKNSDGEIKNVFTNSAVDGIVDQRDFFDKDIADKASLENYYVVKDRDYVYNPRISNIAPVGPISKNKTGKSGAMSPLYTVFRFIDKNNEFYEYYFKTVHWFNAIRKVSNSGARFDRMSITDSVFMNIPVLVPSPKEQQKIAACLSSLDEVITAESQKLEVLKDHKKGLLQNLLPQEGETVPKFRFKEFEDSGEWEETALGEIGEPLMCKRIFKEETTPNPKDGIPFYKIGTFGRLADSYISTEIYEEYKRKYSFPKVGDILISASGTIGRLVVYDGSPAYFQDSNIIWLGHNQVKILNKFLFQCYTNLKWQTTDGGVISRLYNSDFKRMKISFPENQKEQEKIADTLSSVDDLINVQNQKLEALQLHKKGLLQGLFPNINEVTE